MSVSDVVDHAIFVGKVCARKYPAERMAESDWIAGIALSSLRHHKDVAPDTFATTRDETIALLKAAGKDAAAKSIGNALEVAA